MGLRPGKEHFASLRFRIECAGDVSLQGCALSPVELMSSSASGGCDREETNEKEELYRSGMHWP